MQKNIILLVMFLMSFGLIAQTKSMLTMYTVTTKEWDSDTGKYNITSEKNIFKYTTNLVEDILEGRYICYLDLLCTQTDIHISKMHDNTNTIVNTYLYNNKKVIKLLYKKEVAPADFFDDPEMYENKQYEEYFTAIPPCEKNIKITEE